MKNNTAIIVICLVAVAAYLGYSHLGKGGPAPDDKNLKASFQALSMAVASGNQTVIKNLVSPGFSDTRIGAEELVQSLARKHATYTASIDSVKISGGRATVSYTRSWKDESGKAQTGHVQGETWIREKGNSKVWKLGRLARADKWFLTAGKSAGSATASGAPLANASGKKGLRRVSMTADQRYSAANRRDPFRPLIALEGMEEIGITQVCEPERERELLETYDLYSLKLSGVIMSGPSSMALVRAPDGKGYTVRFGMHMGKMCGKVLDIGADYMVIREKKAKPGTAPLQFKPVETTLKLRPEES